MGSQHCEEFAEIKFYKVRVELTLCYFINPSDKVKILLRNIVVFTCDDFLEASDGFGSGDEFSWAAGELLSHEEWL